jgi:beta-mannanase
MRKQGKRWVWVTSLMLFIVSTFVADSAAPRHLFGLAATGPNQGLDTAGNTAAALGRHLDVLHFYEAWEWKRPLPVDLLAKIDERGALAEITWEPWDPRIGRTQPKYTLDEITSGAYDAYITTWARGAASYGQPLLLRFAHEMNGTWYPWSARANGGSSTAFVNAWRHVHDLFAQAGASNVRWVWCPNITTRLPTSLDSVYPGDSYVDIIAIDGYNGGSELPSMGGWQTPKQVFGSTLEAATRLAPTKPLWINEVGSSEYGGNKAQWSSELFRYLKTTPVTAVIWFNIAPDGRPDWRLDSSPASQAAAAHSLRDW